MPAVVALAEHLQLGDATVVRQPMHVLVYQHDHGSPLLGHRVEPDFLVPGVALGTVPTIDSSAVEDAQVALEADLDSIEWCLATDKAVPAGTRLRAVQRIRNRVFNQGRRDVHLTV